jgi:hypothetical protein
MPIVKRLQSRTLTPRVLFALTPALLLLVPQPSQACQPGYVAREAIPGDQACVTEAEREFASVQNRSYPEETCTPGLVWREVDPSDHRCVTPEERTLAWSQNDAAKARGDTSSTSSGTPTTNHPQQANPRSVQAFTAGPYTDGKTVPIGCEKFSFLTALPTIPTIQVSRRPPLDGEAFAPEQVVAAETPTALGPRTQHALVLCGLTPGARHFYVVIIDGPGNTQRRATSEFQTAVRMD